MKRKDPLIVGRNSVRDMHHLRLMALLQELVRTWGYTGYCAGAGDRPQDGDLQRAVGPADTPGA